MLGNLSVAELQQRQVGPVWKDITSIECDLLSKNDREMALSTALPSSLPVAPHLREHALDT